MALFAYVFAFGQTSYPYLSWDVSDIAGVFAGGQLLYGALHEYKSLLQRNSSDTNSSDESFFQTMFRDAFEENHKEFQNYLQTKNFSSVYQYLYSIAKISCFYSNVDDHATHFVRYLIRYGRVCQVCNF